MYMTWFFANLSKMYLYHALFHLFMRFVGFFSLHNLFSAHFICIAP